MAAAQRKVADEVHYERASATLLSMQPENPTPPKQANNVWWSVLENHLQQRLVSLQMWRQSWFSQNWNDIATFLLPRRSIWLTQSAGGFPSANNMTRGREINGAIVDPTGTYALRVCAAGLMSGLASPSRPWFKIVPASRKAQVDAAGKAWMDSTEDRIYTVLAGSNFYNCFAQECEDLAGFGTGPSIIYEDDKDIIRLYNPAVGEYYLASSSTTRVDGLYRLFVMTVAQIVDFFGVDNCPEDIQKLWEQKGAGLEIERQIGHSIEPNFGIAPNDAGKVPGNFTWREVYWVYGSGSNKPLSMRGFVDQPFTAARWSTQSNDAYGRGPGMDVLPDVMQLQVMTRRLAEAIEKQVRPPLVADMSMKNQPSSSLPGHVTYVANLGPSTGMKSMYEVNPDVAAMTQNIMAIEARIKVGLFNDLFQMLQELPGDQRTAYEIAQRIQEKLQIVGPVIENLLSESLKPKLKRIFGIMKRKGLIDPAPPSMQGVALDIDFVSMLALAQKGAATGGIERLLSAVGSVVPIFPQARDNINIDETIREFNDLLGNPSKILYSPEQVAQARQDQAAQQAEQQQMDKFSQLAEAAGKAAPAGAVLSKLGPTGAQGGVPQ